MKRASSYLLLTLGLTLLIGCSASPADGTGSVQVAVSMPQALSASDVARVKVTVSASDMSSVAVELAKTTSTWGGVVGNIPVGSNRSFLAEAFDSTGALRFQGSTSAVTITASQTTAVALMLQEQAPPPPYSNEAPVIDSVVAASTSVQAGASLSLTAAVHDPNTGDSLTLAWTASGGTFSAPTAASTSWTAPASPGVQTLTFTVTDSQGAAVSVALTVNVVLGASTGSAAITVSFNLSPVVSKVSASLNRLDAGQSTAVSALAADADGDALSYQWTASCPGTWTNAASNAASFVPSSVPAGACNNCRLTVTVQDSRGGQNSGSLNLCISSSSAQRFPPSITNSYQSASSASAGQTVVFDVTAMDSQASSLSFAWSANTGSLAAAQNTASTSHVVWTAPSCAFAGITPSLTVTVTNAFNLTASQSFTVAGLPVCLTGWANTGSMVTGRETFTATLLNNGKVLVTGGDSGGSGLTAAELYNPATGTWSATASMISPRWGHSEVLLPQGKVLIAGGYTGSSALAAAEVYDPASGNWNAAPPMASARRYPTATLLNNSKVLVAGGNTGSSTLTTAELYTPASGTWSSASSMATARWFHTATLLPDGRLLVAGGQPQSGYTATAELYDPATDTWSTTGAMASARRLHTATLLPNGKVLVTGGQNSSGYLATAELYDPATGTWSAVPSMATSRYSHTATLLPTGKVLIAGGYNGSSYLAGAELYDPATGTWSATTSLAASRQSHMALLLPGGKVLVAGGFNSGGLHTSAALYTP